MKAHYATFEQSKLLKEKGFDNIQCSGYYHICDGYTIGYAFCYSNINKQSDSVLLVPEQWQVVEWLRIKHGIWVGVTMYINHDGRFYSANIQNNDNKHESLNGYTSPEEAYSATFYYVLLKYLN